MPSVRTGCTDTLASLHFHHCASPDHLQEEYSAINLKSSILWSFSQLVLQILLIPSIRTGCTPTLASLHVHHCASPDHFQASKTAVHLSSSNRESFSQLVFTDPVDAEHSNRLHWHTRMATFSPLCISRSFTRRIYCNQPEIIDSLIFLSTNVHRSCRCRAFERAALTHSHRYIFTIVHPQIIYKKNILQSTWIHRFFDHSLSLFYKSCWFQAFERAALPQSHR